MPLTLLVTSPRVAPGLMSWPAWRAIASADRLLASDASMPLARAVGVAGHQVDVLPAPTVDDLLAAGATEDVVWLASDEEASHLPSSLADAIVSAAEAGLGPEVEVLHGSYDVPGARLLDLVAVMDRLRAECPWDREQTHRSLARYLLEESYETLEAIESGDSGHLEEELGDLLLQVLFHARIASEGPGERRFDIDDVAAGIVAKLVHRHPHVFAGLDVDDLEELDRNWETLKAAEKGRSSALDGIPLSLPALALADKVVGRAVKAGLSPLVQEGARVPVVEPVETTTTSLGDRLLALVVEARSGGLEAEQELRDAVRRLVVAVRSAEVDALADRRQHQP